MQWFLSCNIKLLWPRLIQLNSTFPHTFQSASLKPKLDLPPSASSNFRLHPHTYKPLPQPHVKPPTPTLRHDVGVFLKWAWTSLVVMATDLYRRLFSVLFLWLFFVGLRSLSVFHSEPCVASVYACPVCVWSWMTTDVHRSCLSFLKSYKSTWDGK